jgi:dihydrofolate reductase
MISIIVAVAKNSAIGRRNELLWHISQDLKYFKAVTTGHPVVMGRKTYESVGRPLPGRRNIILSRGGNIESPDIKNPQTTSFEICNDMESLISMAKKSDDEFFITGGGELYKQFFNCADKLYITHIEAVANDADTFFPVINSSEWRLDSITESLHDEENNLDFEFAIYKRI